jgi:hypothetical protein
MHGGYDGVVREHEGLNSSANGRGVEVSGGFSGGWTLLVPDPRSQSAAGVHISHGRIREQRAWVPVPDQYISYSGFQPKGG